MRIFKHRHNASLKVLLAVLLLAVQGAALAHDLAHFEDRDAGMCRVCSVYTGTNGIAAVYQLPAVPAAHHECGPAPSAPGVHFRPVSPGFARAPPK